jgi:predicted O-methyltransferase YrrM
MFVLKSFHGDGPRFQRAWTTIRTFIPKEAKLFYEGCLTIPGQLWYSERKALYQAIRAQKPRIVFEVGTWFGGGSTFFIGQALYDNGFGILHTVEADPAAHNSAVAAYQQELPNLMPHLKFFLGNSLDVYPELLTTLGSIDALFLDGAQDPVQTLDEFLMFQPFLKSGSLLIAHDWDNEKMQLLRSRIEQLPDWYLKKKLTAPHSLGFVIYRRF